MRGSLSADMWKVDGLVQVLVETSAGLQLRKSEHNGFHNFLISQPNPMM